MNRRGRERRGRPAPAPVERRTEHALAEVVADPGRPSTRTLLLDGREAGQVDLNNPRRLGFAYMRRIADLIDAFRPEGTGLDVVHVGGGACALARYVEATRPRSRQLVLELDAGVVALAREHLGLRATPRLRVKVGDAAALLPRARGRLRRPGDRRRLRRPVRAGAALGPPSSSRRSGACCGRRASTRST